MDHYLHHHSCNCCVPHEDQRDCSLIRELCLLWIGWWTCSLTLHKRAWRLSKVLNLVLVIWVRDAMVRDRWLVELIQTGLRQIAFWSCILFVFCEGLWSLVRRLLFLVSWLILLDAKVYIGMLKNPS